jgi:tetratricopeptide (TPR) repeat protein
MQSFDASDGSHRAGRVDESWAGRSRDSTSLPQLQRVYRSESSTERSGWTFSRDRRTTISSAPSFAREGPAASRLRTDDLRALRPTGLEARPLRNERVDLDQRSVQAPTEPITRDWIVQRYRRAGALAVAQTHEDTLRNDPTTSRWNLSHSRSSSPTRSSTSERSNLGGVLGQTTNKTSRGSALGTENEPKNAHELERAGIAHLSQLNANHPNRAQAVLRRGESVARATSLSVQMAATAGCCMLVSPSNCGWCWGAGAHAWNPAQQACCMSSWWWWGSSSLWWPCWGPAWGFGYWFKSCGFWGWGSPYYAQPFVYYYSPPPVYYAYALDESANTEVAADAADSGTSADAAYESRAEIAERPDSARSTVPIVVPAAAMSNAGPDSGAIPHAASEYLTLGDRAFGEGRFSDAVYAYGRAAEAAPSDALVHLILADALFATGDYHYCAFALRKALELDPSLIDAVLDKHSFYGDPTEFDRQLDLLERYVQDHFVDDDARLVLAANYLFANRPAQAADLLESAFSLAVRESAAGQVILKRAESLRHASPGKG